MSFWSGDAVRKTSRCARKVEVLRMIMVEEGLAFLRTRKTAVLVRLPIDQPVEVEES